MPSSKYRVSGEGIARDTEPGRAGNIQDVGAKPNQLGDWTKTGHMPTAGPAWEAGQ